MGKLNLTLQGQCGRKISLKVQLYLKAAQSLGSPHQILLCVFILFTYLVFLWVFEYSQRKSKQNNMK